MSLVNALLTVIFVYKYKSTNDTKWLKHITLIMLIYNFVDLILEINLGVTERISFIVHHLISIICNSWARINSYGISILPEMCYTLLVTESSTIFLNINKLIKIYLESNPNTSASLTNILKNITSLNYLFFLPLFIYFRIYRIFIDGVFNPNFYATLLTPRDDIWYYVNRIILLCLPAISLLNIYWLIPVYKATHKKFSHLFKSKTDKEHKNSDKKKELNENKGTNVDKLVEEIDCDGDYEEDEVSNKKVEEVKEEVSNKKEEEKKEEVSNKKEEEKKEEQEEVSNKKEEEVKE
jgi:hypothetical protein